MDLCAVGTSAVLKALADEMDTSPWALLPAFPPAGLPAPHSAAATLALHSAIQARLSPSTSTHHHFGAPAAQRPLLRMDSQRAGDKTAQPVRPRLLLPRPYVAFDLVGQGRPPFTAR